MLRCIWLFRENSYGLQVFHGNPLRGDLRLLKDGVEASSGTPAPPLRLPSDAVLGRDEVISEVRERGGWGTKPDWLSTTA